MNRSSRFALAVARKSLPLALALLATLALGAPPPTDDRLEKIRAAELNLIRGLVDQGVLTREKAQELLRKAGVDPTLLDSTAGSSVPSPVITVPLQPPPPAALLPEETRKEIIEQVRQEAVAQERAEGSASPGVIPDWVRRLSFSGDMQLRYQRNDFASDNADDAGGLLPLGLNAAQAVNSWYQLPPGTIQNVLDSHEYLLMRTRFGVNAKVNDMLDAAVRVTMVAGNNSSVNPVYDYVTLGTYGRPFAAAISLAYLDWHPLPAWTLTGGRMLIPYLKSDLIFAPDLTLDGVAVGFAPQWSPQWGAFVNIGAHPLQTNQSGPFNTAADQWLFAGQVGLSWRRHDETQLRAAAAYYDFSGLQGKPDPLYPTNNTLNDDSAPLFRQFGNTMFDLHYLWDMSSPLYAYAGEFRLVNFAAEYEYARFDPVRLRLQLDWVRNVGFNPTQIEQRIGPAIAGLPYTVGPNGTQLNGVTYARTNGYFVRLQVGAAELQRFGDWQVFGGARYLERDAVPDAFTSPDYRLGGTDNQATFFGVNWGLTHATSLTLRYISARSIDSGPKLGVDTWFLDFNGRF